ncbi:MAG: aldose 1-epimerase family protein, partial [Actinomycetota bacterium]
QELCSVSVGAGLRRYDVAGRALLDGFEADERPGGGRGQTLVPWPNRVAGATYRFDGVEQQLPVTERATGNAIHGLARWVPWQLLDRTLASVTWGHVIPPQPGWPTSLDCRVTYALDDGGLTVTTTATNLGDAPCPYGTGSHPYLRAGAGPVDAMTLQVSAGTWYDVDAAGIPTATHPVAGTEHDLSRPRPIGDRVLDTCFGDLRRDDDGRWRVHLTAAGGEALTLWADQGYGWVQLFSGDTLPEPARRRGLAVEPMTCPPDAFNSGEGLVRLEPGRTHTATWGLTSG